MVVERAAAERGWGGGGGGGGGVGLGVWARKSCRGPISASRPPSERPPSPPSPPPRSAPRRPGVLPGPRASLSWPATSLTETSTCVMSLDPPAPPETPLSPPGPRRAGRRKARPGALRALTEPPERRGITSPPRWRSARWPCRPPRHPQGTPRGGRSREAAAREHLPASPSKTASPLGGCGGGERGLGAAGGVGGWGGGTPKGVGVAASTRRPGIGLRLSAGLWAWTPPPTPPPPPSPCSLARGGPHPRSSPPQAQTGAHHHQVVA